jgi:phosphoribosylanthranilate isomerase
VTRVKICGLTRLQDLELAVELGAHAVGVVLEPSSPRAMQEQEAQELIMRAPPFVTKVAVFGQTRPGASLNHFDFVQSVEWPADVAQPRVQVIRLREERAGELVRQVDPKAAAVLLDAYSEAAYGGTGERVDWDIAAEFASSCPKPVILAGGLTPDNVAEAIELVQPYAVDVSSGVEAAPGVKDPAKLKDFLQAVQAKKVRER